MNIKKFREIVGPTVERIEQEQQSVASGSFRPFAELLIAWYERKLTEAEAQKGKRDNSN